MLRQLQEAGVEHHIAVVIFQHGRFLVIDQHGFHAASEVTECPHQRLVGMLRITARRRKDVEATRVTQRVHGEVDFAALAGHFRVDFSPVMLQLVTRWVSKRTVFYPAAFYVWAGCKPAAWSVRRDSPSF